MSPEYNSLKKRESFKEATKDDKNEDTHVIRNVVIVTMRNSKYDI